MKHTVRESGQWQHTLTVEVPADQVDARLAEVSRNFQKHASIPGFRKGKVLDRVRQDYAAEIEREFLERFIPEVTHDALHQADLKAVVPPSVQNLRFTPGQPLTFDAVVDVAPQVEVKDWKGFALVRRVRAVDEAELPRPRSPALVDRPRARGPRRPPRAPVRPARLSHWIPLPAGTSVLTICPGLTARPPGGTPLSLTPGV